MAKKRLTDAEKWRDPWFRRLPIMVKIFWNYICDTCDDAGVWVVDADRYEFEAGEKVDLELQRQHLGDRIRVIDGGRKWAITKFLAFQYPRGLSPDARPHIAVLRLVEHHGIIDLLNPLGKSANSMHTVRTVPRTVQDKDKDKDKDSNSNARASEPSDIDFAPSVEAPRPVAAAKPGILELRVIPGLKLIPDSLPAWLALAEEVGLDAIRAARDELVLAKRDCWVADVASAAYRYRDTKQREIVDLGARQRQERAKEVTEATLEKERLRGHEEAARLVVELDAMPTGSLNDIRGWVAELRTGIAKRDNGSRVNGPFSPMSQIKRWLEKHKASA